ncbi:MAG TPA: ArsA family ATPase [Candidatus Thermoplasmatota archaeon]|nr:ArsA family ATPase [Candidatus Thermoplasmatota archaeon]
MAARISLFLGKGGVGRTTLACAFAVDRAAAGERVLLASVVAHDDPVSRIQHEAAGVDTGGRLEFLRIDARALVDDLVRRVTRLGALSEYVVRHPSYDSLVEIVPGVREMAIFHLLEKKRHEGFDRIVLDAPATGHGIHFLEAPEKGARILAGPLRERAEALRDMLKDAATTDVVIVTIPEETPVRETIELAQKLRAQGFTLDNVVVNRWLPRLFSDPGSRRVLDALERDAGAREALQAAVEERGAPIEVEEWLAALRVVAGQRREAETHLAELRRVPARLAVVPLIPDSSRRLLRVAAAMRAPPEVFA